MNNKYPTTKPSLNLDFANTKSLDPRITFRRGTPGTYYDGVTHVKAEENLLSYSEDFANAYWTKSNCSITSDSVDAPDGSVSAADKIVENTATSTHQLSVGAADILNKAYTLSYFVKAAGRNSCRISFSGQGSAVFNISTGVVIINEFISASINAVGNDWYRVSATAIKTNTNADIFIGPALDDGTLSYQGDGTSGIYVWGAQLEQRDTVTAYTKTEGTPITKYQPKLMTAAADKARFDHDPITGESKGLLIEESRTNLFSYSESFSSWQYNSNVTAKDNSVVAPDGTIGASEIVETTSNTQHNVAQSIAVTGQKVFSVFVKKGVGSRNFRITDYNATDGEVSVTYNLSTGDKVSEAGSPNSTITNYSNGWYRISITSTTTITSIYYIQLMDNNTTTYTGDGYSSIYIWGAQLEAGSFPTSYIKTTGASATRSADNASITGENFSSWYRQDEGSLGVDYNLYGIEANSTIFSLIDPDSVQGYINLYCMGITNQQLNCRIENLSATPENMILENTASIGQHNVYVGYSDTNASSVIDSGDILESSISASFKADTLLIGRNTQPVVMNGHIKKIAYYPQRLTNEQLQNLTK